MTPETVFAKSAKGIQEIETRAHKLGSRLRQALILVDGIKTVDELVADAGDMGEAYQAHLEELAKLGFLTDISSDEAVVVPSSTGPHKALAAAPKPVDAPPPPAKHVEAAPTPRPAPPKPAPVPAAKPAQAPETVEYNSPIKWRMQDLLVEAMGLDTGKVGVALNQCRNREELAKWVDHAVAPIEAAAGRAKAKVFYKTAKKLIGG